MMMLAALDYALCRSIAAMLRGREIVRTCADGAPSARIADCVRMKSTSARNRRYWKKATTKQFLFLSITVFSVRMRFSSERKTRLARASAQWPLLARNGIATPHLGML